ncbi:MAG TPA: flavodoxin domain-containing protein [Marmoricola sp.]
MKALVMYESMFGNSAQVAEAIADGLGEHAEVTLRDVTTVAAGDLPEDVDLLVAGGPTHAFSMSRATTRADAIKQGATRGVAARGLREWIEGVAELRGLPFSTFDTRVSRARHLPGSAARSAARALRRRGGRLVVHAQSFFVNDVSGPLETDELDRARAWGAELAHATQGHRVA